MKNSYFVNKYFMVKYIILLLTILFSENGYSQFSGMNFDSIFISKESSYKTSFPNLLIHEKSTFDSLRFKIHQSGVKYRLIEFDSLGNRVNEEIFEFDQLNIPRITIGEMEEKQFSLVDLEDRIMKMIYLDPDI